jgi:predicted permease
MAVGASRGRLLRQLFTESLLLAAAGATAGLLLATFLSRVLVRLLPLQEGTLPLDLTPDARILAFTSAVAFGASLFFGLFPAWRVLQARPVKLGLRRALVAAQVCLSLVVLAGAGLFVRTLSGLRSVDAGFDRDHVLTFWLDAPRSYTRGQSAELVARALDTLSTMPGVTSASAAVPGPFRAGKASRTVLVHGVPGEQSKSVDIQSVMPTYFTTLGTPLLSGRFLEERDRGRPPAAVLVNEAFVRQHLDGPAVGRRVGLNTEKDGGPYVPIAGVVRSVRHQGLRDVPVPEVYVPMRRDESAAGVSFQLRGGATVEEVRKALHQLDGAVLITDARYLSDRVEDSLSRERLLAVLCEYFAGLALLLAAVGLYGVVAYSVSRRTREIGVRVAIGAHRREILWMVIREALVMTAWGTALGLPAAHLTTRLASGLLYDVKPGDPATLAFAACVLLATGAVAAILPARRAASIEPSEALRYE